MNETTSRTRATAGMRGDIRERILSHVAGRFYRILNYLSIYAFVVVVYGGALLTDYLIFTLVEWLLREDVQKYPNVALWFDYARMGLALLLIVLAVAHGVISTYTQLRLDLALSREGEEG